MQTLTFTLPSFRADAGEALIVRQLLTHSSMLAGFGAAGGHQGLTVISWNTQTFLLKHTFNENKLQTAFNISSHCLISCRSHELGDNPTQMDTESSFNQCYQKILARFCQVLEACRDISLSVSTTHGSYRKPAPVSGHCEAICCSVRQEAGKQEMCQAPRSHPGTSKSLLLFKLLWIFPKRRLDKYKKICP